MKIDGLTRKRNYHGRWDELINRATKILNTLFKMVEKKFEKFPRNIILDQTNVYESARRRKFKSFSRYGTKVAVVIVTDNTELQKRTKKRETEEGKMVPLHAVLEMKANFSLPSLSEGWNKIEFPEQKEDASRRIIAEFNNEGKLSKGDQIKIGNKRASDKPAFDDALNKKPRTDLGASSQSDDRGSRYGDRRDGRNGSNDRGRIDRGTDRRSDERGHQSDNRRDSASDRRGRPSDTMGRSRGGPETSNASNRGYNDNNRGGYNDRSIRGGYNDRTSRGGFNDSNRGGSRGGYSDRNSRWEPPQYSDNNTRRDANDGKRDSAEQRPGFDSRGSSSMGNRGNYDSGRSGYDSSRGGYQSRFGDQKRDSSGSRDVDKKSYDDGNNRSSFGSNRRDADYARRDERYDSQADFRNTRDTPKDNRSFYGDR